MEVSCHLILFAFFFFSLSVHIITAQSGCLQVVSQNEGGGEYYFGGDDDIGDEIDTEDNHIEKDYSGSEAAVDKLPPERSLLETSRLLALRFQDGGILTKTDFRRLLEDINEGLKGHGGADLAKTCREMDMGEILEFEGLQLNCSYILSKCSSLDAVYSRYAEDEGLMFSELAAALQEATFTLTNPDCWVSHMAHKGYKPTIGQAWGYGIGFVTLVAIISNVGALLTPFMSSALFQRLLQFLVAMGAGTLAATGLLVLIPEAFDIVSIEEIGDDYIWKSATALLSIYVFFVSERFLKFFLHSREEKHIQRTNSLHVSAPNSLNNHDGEESPMNKAQVDVENNKSPDHGHSHFISPNPTRGAKSRPVAPVAWMVMIGDAIHNFVDGMAIGAAFTENTYLGVSIGIAVLCEELPHELSDVAILLHSGLTMKRALLLNFLSACMAYLGLVVGVMLGEGTTATRWVLAIAGGLFLYVPLCDMLPDMSQHLDMLMKRSKEVEGHILSREVWIVLLCQSLGLIIGIAIIFVVVTFSGSIEVSN